MKCHRIRKKTVVKKYASFIILCQKNMIFSSVLCQKRQHQKVKTSESLIEYAHFYKTKKIIENSHTYEQKQINKILIFFSVSFSFLLFFPRSSVLIFLACLYRCVPMVLYLYTHFTRFFVFLFSNELESNQDCFVC